MFKWNGYATWYLSWNTYIYNYNIDGKSHREVHKIPNYSPGLSLWEIISHGKIGCFLLQKMNPILDYFKNK
jgi:hypothetical protein